VQGTRGNFTPYHAEKYVRVFEPVSFNASLVTPVIAPDTAGQIIPFINNTRRRLLISEAYIRHWSSGRKNPYLEAAIDRARAGADVRILLDSYPYNTEGPDDNDEMVREITAIADREQLPLRARLIDLGSSGLLKLHAKGIISDDSVFISSINWNENSPVFNREAGLIIADRTAAGYFASVFEQDWSEDRKESPPPVQNTDLVKQILAGVVIVFLVLLYRFRYKK
jgi:phosphatidylserine/phosphatidylglycerophosphate/cardiolipin synthase-like enzyme